MPKYPPNYERSYNEMDDESCHSRMKKQKIRSVRDLETSRMYLDEILNEIYDDHHVNDEERF